MQIPQGLQRLAAEPGGPEWLARLPALVAGAARRWELVVGSAFPGSYVSLALAARRADGEEVVLKVPFPHREGEHEAAALACWDGDGAVRLLDHDPATGALLLERCRPGAHLSVVEPEQALTVVVGLLPRLWRPAAEPFTTLAEEAARWAAGLGAAWDRAGRPCDEELVSAARGAIEDLVPTQPDQVLLHQDLHADNVLSAEREPWLVIDPKPLVGERAFGLSPVIRSYELGHSRAAVLHRLDRLSAALDVDRERARRWALAQAVAWGLDHPRHLETAAWLLG